MVPRVPPLERTCSHPPACQSQRSVSSHRPKATLSDFFWSAFQDIREKLSALLLCLLVPIPVLAALQEVRQGKVADQVMAKGVVPEPLLMFR